jgi:hypothetical protein
MPAPLCLEVESNQAEEAKIRRTSETLDSAAAASSNKPAEPDGAALCFEEDAGPGSQVAADGPPYGARPRPLAGGWLSPYVLRCCSGK